MRYDSVNNTAKTNLSYAVISNKHEGLNSGVWTFS